MSSLCTLNFKMISAKKKNTLKIVKLQFSQLLLLYKMVLLFKLKF